MYFVLLRRAPRSAPCPQGPSIMGVWVTASPCGQPIAHDRRIGVGEYAAAMGERRVATDEEKRALASSLRLRILRLALDEPLTNKEIADRLGRNPASVLHHVRTLVETGFLVAEPERRGARGAREVPYRATRKSWRLTDAGAEEAMIEAFLTERTQAGATVASMSRLGLRLGSDAREEFLGLIQAVLEDYAARPPDPDGEPLSVFFTAHADPGRRPPAQPPASTGH